MDASPRPISSTNRRLVVASVLIIVALAAVVAVAMIDSFTKENPEGEVI